MNTPSQKQLEESVKAIQTLLRDTYGDEAALTIKGNCVELDDDSANVLISDGEAKECFDQIKQDGGEMRK